jgi:hypothetical protein
MTLLLRVIVCIYPAEIDVKSSEISKTHDIDRYLLMTYLIQGYMIAEEWVSISGERI